MSPIHHKTKQFYLFFFIVLIIAACNSDKKVDVSDIKLDVKIERFDQDFDAMRTKPMAQQAAYLQNKYGIFYKDFLGLFFNGYGNTADTSYFFMARKIFASQAYLDLKHDVDSVYSGSLGQQNEELTDAFRRIKYYYPKKNLPKVYAYFSGFQAQTSIGNGYFAIGLDLFLGSDSRFYPALVQNFPKYLSRRFNKANIAPRVVEGIAREDMFPESDNDRSMLAKMIYNGKILYFLDKVLPDVADSVKIGYTTQQTQWAETNKANIWTFFLEENLLYETDFQKINTYLNEAPFTPGLGEGNESAPKLGAWTGWQIVRQYMDKHPEVTLPQLMADGDAQKILNESKYRPK